MLKLNLILIGLCGLCSTTASTSIEKIINCYWGTWSHYRPGEGAFTYKNIDAKLCTHLSYSFEGINANGEIKILDTWLDLASGLDNIAKAMTLKKDNPKLKFIAVVGGWNEGSAKYSEMAADPAKRRTFVQSVLKFLQEYKFDGLDLDWEYPARRDYSSPNDKSNFVILLKEIYQALKAKGYVFGIAVGASVEKADISYQMPEVSRYVDFINLMTYDFATWEAKVFGHNAPLRGQGVNNVESSVKFWLSRGIPASKLLLGLAFYGHTFKLANGQQYSPGSATAGPGAAGPYTRQAGYLGYNEICKKVGSNNYQWSETAAVPFLHNSHEVVSYDNAKSIAMKVDLANALNLAGVMIWSIDTDDFLGSCGTKNMLLKTVNNKLGRPQDMSWSRNEELLIEMPALPNSNQPNKPKKPAAFENCSIDGLFPHKSDCTRFVQCAGGVAYELSCSNGLHFDANHAICNWPELAKCQ